MAGWEGKLREAIEKAAITALNSDNVWPPPLINQSNMNLFPGKVIESHSRHKDPRIVDRPINLGFDGSIEVGFPHGWFNSVGHVSDVSDKYAVRVVEREDGHRGRCLMLYKNDEKSHDFGSVMQRFQGKFLAGCTVKLEGELRTKDVNGWAGLWLRADGENIPNIFFDNMRGHSIKGTTGWAWHSIEARLPDETRWLNLGVVLSGSGVLWADNLRFLAWRDDGMWVEA